MDEREDIDRFEKVKDAYDVDLLIEHASFTIIIPPYLLFGSTYFTLCPLVSLYVHGRRRLIVACTPGRVSTSISNSLSIRRSNPFHRL